MSTLLPRLGRTATTLTGGASLVAPSTVLDMQHDEGVRVATGAGGTISNQRYVGRGDSAAGQLPTGIKLQGDASGYIIERNRMTGFKMLLGPDDYWNGDGFASELGNSGLVYRHNEAWGNSDRGFDLKSYSTTLDDCTAGDNKVNFSFWNDVQCGTIRSIRPSKRGGSGLPYHIGGYSAIGRAIVIMIEKLTAVADDTVPLFWVEKPQQVTFVVEAHDIRLPIGTKMFGKTSEAPDPIIVWKTSRPGLTP